MQIRILSVLLALFSSLYSYSANAGGVFVDASSSYKLLDPTKNITRKQHLLFKSQDALFKQGDVLLGSSLIAIADFQTTNEDSKFGYLMRHPSSANQVGKTASEICFT